RQKIEFIRQFDCPRFPQAPGTISCGKQSVSIYALTNLSRERKLLLTLRRQQDREERDRVLYQAGTGLRDGRPAMRGGLPTHFRACFIRPRTMWPVWKKEPVNTLFSVTAHRQPKLQVDIPVIHLDDKCPGCR